MLRVGSRALLAVQRRRFEADEGGERDHQADADARPQKGGGANNSSGNARQPRASSTATSNPARTAISAAISTPSTLADRSIER